MVGCYPLFMISNYCPAHINYLVWLLLPISWRNTHYMSCRYPGVTTISMTYYSISMMYTSRHQIPSTASQTVIVVPDINYDTSRGHKKTISFKISTDKLLRFVNEKRKISLNQNDVNFWSPFVCWTRHLWLEKSILVCFIYFSAFRSYHAQCQFNCQCLNKN